MSPALRHGILFALILFAGAGLRVLDLAARPMHADEANQAVKVGRMLDGNSYRFDPADHHGPTLYYFGWIAAGLRGERTLAELTEPTLRLVPAFFGTLAILLLGRLAAPLGAWPALSAALFLTLSPPAVYYSRYFIQETLLVCFTLAALLAGFRWLRGGGPAWAAAAGASAGLMLATKVSAVLFIAVVLFSLVILDWKRLGALGVKAWVAATTAALLTAGLFYSSFGSNVAGLRDSLVTFGPMLGKAAGGATGHEKPWWYYGGLFTFRREWGYIWDQTFFLLLALAGGVLSFRGSSRFARFFALSTALCALVLALAPYKTPWIVVNLVPGLAVLAAVALSRLRAAAATPLVLATAFVLGWQCWQAAFHRPADPRNPYAYVHSSPDVRKITAITAAAPPGLIKVISPEYWPLPWYLRARAEVGYWTTVPEDCDAAVVIVAADLADDVRSRQRGTYQTSFLGLRPGFVLVVFTRADP